MEKSIILFGTGQYGQLYTQIMEEFSVPIVCYADNDQKKWGTDFLEKKIIAPAELTVYSNVPILIACLNTHDIFVQLKKMGLSHRVIFIHQLKIENQKKLYGFYHFDQKSCNNVEASVWIDNFEGNWGGIEDWSHDVVMMLRKENVQAFVLESCNQNVQRDELEQFIIRVDRNLQQWLTTHLQLIHVLYSKMPFVLFNNRSREVLYAAEILKCLYPDQVKIITVLHCDLDRCFKEHAAWDSYIDKYLCISSMIQRNFCMQQRIGADRTVVRTNIIASDPIEREYTKKEEAIRIAFACRLAKEQKRADLLPEIIERLEQSQLNYQVEIAGDGECAEYLQEYVKKNHLEMKVKYLGFIPKQQMGEYWKRQDIYLNLSEYEGLSLAMLEAMSYGAIPVVTKVSGVDDIIENGVNGFTYEMNDLDGIANGIIYLGKHKELLRMFGNEIRKTLKKKCDERDYIRFFHNLIRSV